MHAADPLHEPLRDQRPPQLDGQDEEPQQDGAVGVDPEQTEHGKEEQPARIGSRLGQEQQLEREPHQGEVEPPVARHDPGDADGEQDDDGGDPTAPRAEGPRVGRAGHEAQPAEDDGVEAVSRVPEGTEQRSQGDLGAPFVGHPATVRLRVAERVEPHEGVVGQHPLAGRQRPELVVGQVGGARHRRHESDPDDDADDLDRTLRDPAARRRRGRRFAADGGGAGRRHIEGLDDPGARLHCSPLTPVPHRYPCVHGTTRPDTPASPDGCDPVASC